LSNHSAIKDLLKGFSGQESILTIPKIYVQYTGDLKTALLLNQIVYFSDKGSRTDGYFYKKYTDWEEEIFLSEKQVRESAKKLKKLGILETKLFKVDGAPTTHYRLDYDKFVDSILTFRRDGISRNGGMESDEKVVSSYTVDYKHKNTNIVASRKQAFDEDSDVVKLVNFFVDEIRKNRPEFKGSSKSWFTDMDKLLRIDKRDPSEVCRVIRFAQADDFWKSNILSVKKLREKYDSLAIKYHQTIEKLNAQKSSSKSPVAYQPVELDLNAGED